MNTDADTLQARDDYFIGRFQAMASPCEILMDVQEENEARRLLDLAHAEARRIESKFSRYRDNNIIYKLNHAQGNPVEVDAETAALLDYARQCYDISDGLFDVTSGVLRKVWRFDGSDRVPTKPAVKALLKHIGWQKIRWQPPVVTVPRGMEIDLGGIGKEYAVDRTAQILGQHTQASVLVNFGGDLCTGKPRHDGRGWVVGIEDPTHAASNDTAATRHSQEDFELLRGGIATSGDTRRFLLKDGMRYSHILNPRTGWPVRDAPHSVTVVAGSCTEAGILATLAMLHGSEAESFLKAQGVRFWCLR